MTDGSEREKRNAGLLSAAPRLQLAGSAAGAELLTPHPLPSSLSTHTPHTPPPLVSRRRTPYDGWCLPHLLLRPSYLPPTEPTPPPSIQQITNKEPTRTAVPQNKFFLPGFNFFPIHRETDQDSRILAVTFNRILLPSASVKWKCLFQLRSPLYIYIYNKMGSKAN